MPSPFEISRSVQVVDVRPWGDRAAEFLSAPTNLAFVTGFILMFTVVMPTLMIISVPALIVIFVAARSASNVLPLRYPPSAIDPRTGKPGKGIMYLGNMEYANDSKNRLPFESLADKFKECWFTDDDMRKHLLVLGSTGSGKSELLKGIFFNALCWGSGFFVADGKADNKLPLDTFNLARFFGRDDDLLSLNFLLAGKTPEQVRNSRRRRTNKTNPFSTADADTIIQMGANLLPKVDGDAKNWQEKALNCWRGLVPALCWLRDHEGVEISIRTFVDYLALTKLEELYAKGYMLGKQSPTGKWPEAFEGLKSYLEVGLPGFKFERALKKHGALPKTPGPGGKPEPLDQDATTYDQHGYRATQLNPALNLLDKTYGHIFTDKFSEIDMVDVTLNNRILVLLIPSLEKSAQEAESLGKLTVACLRVMMGKNLGAEIEGHRRQIFESKATEANYPYIVALDELGYYFADGIAVMFAQARSLGFSMIAAAQDIEKLTEGSRAAEAGAMLANQVVKIFMRIDDANKTNEMIQKYLGKANAALRKNYEYKSGFGFKKLLEVTIEEIPRATLENLQKLDPGMAVLNAMGDTFKVKSFYVGGFLEKHPTQEFHINRFLQVRGLTDEEVRNMSIDIDCKNSSEIKGQKLKDYLTGVKESPDVMAFAQTQPYYEQYGRAVKMIEAVNRQSQNMTTGVSGARRAAQLFMAAYQFLEDEKSGVTELKGRVSSGGEVDRSASHVRALPVEESDGIDPKVALAHETKDARSRPQAPSGELIVHGSGTGEGAKAMDVFEDDPFAFLNEDKPLKRKPASEVLVVSAEQAKQNQTIEAIDRIAGAGLADALGANEAKQDIRSDVAPAMGFTACLREDIESVFARSFELDLTTFATELHREKPEAVVKPNPGTSIKSGWIGHALETASVQLANKGVTVVGFTDKTKVSFARLETALGSLDAGAATAVVERLVANQTTPASTEHLPASIDQIDLLMNEIDALGQNAAIS